jgi:hypothetical protein
LFQTGAIDASMKQIITIIALLLPLTAWAEPLRLLPFTAWAQPLPVPRVGGPGGGCPVGYSWQGSYCVPLGASSRSPPAIPRPPKAVCPWGWAASGSYCVKI